MSRYVDLEGVTWDGKPISSKIQEVQTKHGYLQGITIGWLWGDNVPHIDLEEHDKQIKAEVIDSINDNIHEIYKCQFYCMEDMCEHDSPTVGMCIDCFYYAIQKSLEQLKEPEK